MKTKIIYKIYKLTRLSLRWGLLLSIGGFALFAAMSESGLSPVAPHPFSFWDLLLRVGLLSFLAGGLLLGLTLLIYLPRFLRSRAFHGVLTVIGGLIVFLADLLPDDEEPTVSFMDDSVSVLTPGTEEYFNYYGRWY